MCCHSHSTDSYVHRIGRTGRAGTRGHAVTLLTDDDAPVMPALIKKIKESNQPVPAELARHEGARGGGFDSRAIDE